MRPYKRFLALILCLSVLMCMAGCKEDTEDTTSTTPVQTTDPAPSASSGVPSTPQTSATTPGPTDPSVDAAQVYSDALAQLAARESLRVSADISNSMTVGGEVFTSASQQDITYLGIGTEDPRMQITETATYGTYETDITEVYADGYGYANVYGSDFCAAMTAEEFSERWIPVCAIDAALYDTPWLEENGDGSTLYFTGATELESWLATEATSLISADAEVTLSAEGCITSVHYRASYKNAGGEVTTDVTLTYGDPTVTTIKAPAAEAVELEYLDAARTIEQVYGYLMSFEKLSFNSSVTTYVSAAAYYLGQSYSFNTYGSGSGLQAKVETSIYAMDYSSNQSEEYELEELFLNGKYTASANGGAPETNRSVTADLMTDYVMNYLTEYVFDCAYFTDAVCTDLGSLLLIEFTGSDDMGEIIAGEVSYDIYNDEDLLDSFASDYRTETMEYYVAVDKYLGLPTAIGMYFEGIHTIDGVEYNMIRQVDQSIYLASLDSYRAINEKAAPDTEPEEKATPVFYHVTGSDGQELWLLGTIHVGDERTGYLPHEIYDAFDASDALAVECSEKVFEEQYDASEDVQNAVADAYYYSDGTSVEDHIEDGELYELAEKYMKATGSYSFNAPYLKVAMWSNCIDNFFTQQAYSLSSDKGVDNRLMQMAEEKNKTVLEVESTLFQIQMLYGWSDALSEYLLSGSVSNELMEYKESLEHMYGLWCAGDEADLIEYLTDDTSELTDEEMALYNEYNKAMSWDRNAGMTQKAIEYLESGDTVFMAVGLAHVLADDGLVNALRDAGYTAELVEYE